MRVISFDEVLSVSGGGEEPEMQTVTVTGTQAQVNAARIEGVQPFLAAFGGLAATAITTGACVGIPAALSGPAAPEVAIALGKPCGILGGVAGSLTGIWIARKLNDFARSLN